MMKAEAERRMGAQRERRAGHHYWRATIISRDQPSQGPGAESQDRDVEGQGLPAVHIMAPGVHSACPATHTPQPSRAQPSPRMLPVLSLVKSTRRMLPSAGAALVTATCSFITHPARIQCPRL